jgi:hypothetical protein
MGLLRIDVDWLDDPGVDIAFGPERVTWGRLQISIDGTVVTRHVVEEDRASGPEDGVVGGMSSLAEWVVDHWLSVFWEIRTPFPKILGLSAGRVPGPDAVRRGRVGEGIDPPRLASWQGRHVLGAASSELALPAITFLPEQRQVGVSVQIPPIDLGSTARFLDPGLDEPVWLPKEDAIEEMRRFVEATMARARTDPGAATWASWIAARFEQVASRADNEAERRRSMFGDLVADRWERDRAALGPDIGAYEGVLLDAEIVADDSDAEGLVQGIRHVAASPSGLVEDWKQVRPAAEHSSGPPYERGYRLAESARRHLREPDAPLTDLRHVLEELGVQVRVHDGTPLFRSACIRGRDGAPAVLVAKRHPFNASVAGNRFATAAALGRLLAGGHAAGRAFGAAHGSQARWRATQEANAFAAELLLPLPALRSCGSVEQLSERYGISRTAAERHRENRLDS